MKIENRKTYLIWVTPDRNFTYVSGCEPPRPEYKN
jgi:hypothetical protein